MMNIPPAVLQLIANNSSSKKLFPKRLFMILPYTTEYLIKKDNNYFNNLIVHYE